MYVCLDGDVCLWMSMLCMYVYVWPSRISNSTHLQYTVGASTCMHHNSTRLFLQYTLSLDVYVVYVCLCMALEDKQQHPPPVHSRCKYMYASQRHSFCSTHCLWMSMLCMYVYVWPSRISNSTHLQYTVGASTCMLHNSTRLFLQYTRRKLRAYSRLISCLMAACVCVCVRVCVRVQAKESKQAAASQKQLSSSGSASRLTRPRVEEKPVVAIMVSPVRAAFPPGYSRTFSRNIPRLRNLLFLDAFCCVGICT